LRGGSCTHPGEDDPGYVERHLAADAVGDGGQEEHADELAEGLHGAPESGVLCIEGVYTGGILEAKVADEAPVGDDVAWREQRVRWAWMSMGRDKIPLRTIW
jgi:hypothetical protein